MFIHENVKNYYSGVTSAYLRSGNCRRSLIRIYENNISGSHKPFIYDDIYVFFHTSLRYNDNII